MDWSASGIQNAFRYELVDAQNLDTSYGTLEGVTGCKITEGYYTDNRIGATLDLVGARIPDGQAVRIYHTAKHGTETYTHELGTFLVENDEPTIRYGAYDGSVELLSMLSRYSTDLIGMDYGIGQCSITEWFRATVEDAFGTAVVDKNLASGLEFSSWVWEFGKSTYWALQQAADAIGGRLTVDTHGRTVLEKYVVPKRRSDTFSIDGMYLERGFKNTLGDKCNRVVVQYQPSGEDAVPLYADVRLEKDHPWYHKKLKRWYTNSYTENELANPTIDGINEKAREYLALNKTATSTWEGSGLWHPATPGEVGQVSYIDSKSGVSKSGRMMLQTKEYNCDASMRTTYTFGEVDDE